MYFKSRDGYFGELGGSFIPEILHNTMQELKSAFLDSKKDPIFWQNYCTLLENYSCRPTPLSYCENLTRKLGGAKIYLKREDLGHTGAHKINNVLGQGLLAKKMGKTRVIAETGAGQHGVATATMAAKLGFDCTIYMGVKDIRRQYPNVFWMQKLGAKVIGVTDGGGTLKDSIDEALRDWSQNFENTHYVLGTACGPHPFPEMVAWFQSVIGTEAKKQLQERTQQLPSRIYACIGGGSNAAGIFGAFLDEKNVRLIGVEAGGEGIKTGKHAARLNSAEGQVGIAQGYKTIFLQDKDGQMKKTSSIAAGLDYTGISPILGNLFKTGRMEVTNATNEEVTQAFSLIVENEGIIPALETTHALAAAFKDAKSANGEVFVINLSGRGDKDIFSIADALDDEGFKSYLRGRVQDFGKNHEQK